MKAISLWQPWAALIAVGAKTIETRSWGTNYRGPLLIHAAKTRSHLGAIASCPHFKRICLEREPRFAFGCIVAVAWLYNCRRVESIQSATDNASPERDAELAHSIRYHNPGLSEAQAAAYVNAWRLTDQERAFGDFSPGRFGWLLAVVTQLKNPIPYNGRQGLFDVPDALLASCQPLPWPCAASDPE